MKVIESMKRIVTIFALLGLSLITFACSDSGNSPQFEDFDSWESFNSVASATTNVLAVGLESVFININMPENVQNMYVPTVLERIRLFGDSSSCIMAFDSSMVCVANPFNHSGIGKSYLDTTDARGNKYFDDLYDSFKDFDEYSFWGTMYRKKVNNKETIFGVYGKRTNINSLRLICEYYPQGSTGWFTDSVETRREVVRNVVSAAAHGMESAFSAFVSDSSKQVLLLKYFTDTPRFFFDNSGYLFVDDMNHTSICFPTNKEMEGTSLYDYVDSKGNYPVRMMVNMLKTAKCGWVEYYYTNPTTQKEQKKHVYVERIEGTNLFIGAGCYE